MGKRKSKGINIKQQVFMIFGGIMAVVFMPTTVMLFVGMLPALVAAVVDRTRRKTKSITVGALNLAGCMPFLLELWTGGNGFEKSIEIITDPMAIIVMYAAAGVGYLIDWSMSGIVASVLYQRGTLRQKAIRQRQKELVERWGPEVTGEIPLDRQGFPIHNH